MKKRKTVKVSKDLLRTVSHLRKPGYSQALRAVALKERRDHLILDLEEALKLKTRYSQRSTIRGLGFNPLTSGVRLIMPGTGEPIPLSIAIEILDLSDRPPSPLPRLLQMAENAARAATDAGIKLLKGEEILVSDDFERQRLARCAGCEFSVNMARCRICGCGLTGALSRKPKLAGADCPIGFWPTVPQPNKVPRGTIHTEAAMLPQRGE